MAEAYLITGVAGTGKSSLERRFKEDGHQTIDIDDGYARWQDVVTQEAVAPPVNEVAEWYETHDWMTNTPKLLAKIKDSASTPTPLFVFGNTGNLYTLHPYFKKTFALEYRNEALIRQRIYSRTDNDYGKNPIEFANLLSYYKPMQEKFRSVGAIAIDCSLPIDHIVDFIQSETL